MILEVMPYRVSYLILKLVYYEVANANYYRGLNEADSFINEAKSCENVKTQDQIIWGLNKADSFINEAKFM